MVKRTVDIPTPGIQPCRSCGAPIILVCASPPPSGIWRDWTVTKRPGQFVALDAEPDTEGSFLLRRDPHFAVELPLEWRLGTTPEQRATGRNAARCHRDHTPRCAAPGMFRVGASLERLGRADPRGSKQPPAPRPVTWTETPAVRPTFLCRSCGRDIIWGEVAVDGRWVPLNPEPDPLGLLAFVVNHNPDDQRLVSVMFGQNERPRYIYHHLTCGRVGA